jgi:hypothetical protein
MRDRFSETSFTPIAVMIAMLLVSFAVGFVVILKYPSNKPQPTQIEQPKPVETEKPKTEETINQYARVWKGSEYGLPTGVLVSGEADDNDPSINWLCIQQPDGHMVIVKNVDKILWQAIEKGDVIE